MMAARGAPRRDEAGFTLLEILIALSILAIVTGAAALSLGGGADRDGAAAVRRLGIRLQYAADEALIGGRQRALRPDAELGYRFVTWSAEDRAWITDRDPELAESGGPVLQLDGFGPSGAIRFRPAGESDPFSLRAAAGGRLWRIVGDGINVSVEANDAS